MFSKEMFANRVNLDNPWWKDGQIADEFLKERSRLFLSEFYRYVTLDGMRRVVLLMGPRRVGKTWLLQHTIRRLLAEEVVPPSQIFFLPIDVPVYHGCNLEELIYEAGNIAGVDPRKSRLFVFFDEIQYAKDWETSLKTLSDSYPNIRFVASGSAASVLVKGAMESGAGRFTTLTLPPLSFAEYVYLLNREADFGEAFMETSAGRIQVAQVESMERTNKLFLDYVNYGGYPELVMNDVVRDNPRQFIQRDIVDKVLLRDLPSLYHIEDVRDLAAFFSYLAFHSGMVQSYETLSQGAGLSKHTISNFLRYLEDAFLIVRQDRIGINALSLQRATQFKIYLTNTSLRASMFQPVSSADDIYLGYAVETAISAQLGIDASRHVWRYANWKHGKTQGEIDFVRMNDGTQKPDKILEVKWSDGPFDHPAELREATSFVERNGLKTLFVSSRTQQGIKRFGDTELVFIPTALLAYRLGMHDEVK